MPMTDTLYVRAKIDVHQPLLVEIGSGTIMEKTDDRTYIIRILLPIFVLFVLRIFVLRIYLYYFYASSTTQNLRQKF